MHKFNRGFYFRAQAILCILLTLSMQFSSGCGAGVAGLLLPNVIQIPIDPSGALAQSLSGSKFQGATALEIQPGSQRFSLVFPDDSRQVTGSYIFGHGELVVSEMTLKNGSNSATIHFDVSRRVASIVSAGGLSWVRSDDSAARDTGAPVDAASNPYVTANADLLQIAAQLDEAAASSGGASVSSNSPPTSSTADLKSAAAQDSSGLGVVLGLIAALWAPLAGILQPLLALLTVSAVLEHAAVIRFDGAWRAENASNNLLVTISGGKITKLVDEASRQELQIKSSEIDTVSGNRIVWVVNAAVLGQTTDVQFTIDVQELANGSLEGTLTALGSNLSRVPVTLFRT